MAQWKCIHFYTYPFDINNDDDFLCELPIEKTTTREHSSCDDASFFYTVFFLRITVGRYAAYESVRANGAHFSCIRVFVFACFVRCFILFLDFQRNIRTEGKLYVLFLGLKVLFNKKLQIIKKKLDNPNTNKFKLVYNVFMKHVEYYNIVIFEIILSIGCNLWKVVCRLDNRIIFTTKLYVHTYVVPIQLTSVIKSYFGCGLKIIFVILSIYKNFIIITLHVLSRMCALIYLWTQRNHGNFFLSLNQMKYYSIILGRCWSNKIWFLLFNYLHLRIGRIKFWWDQKFVKFNAPINSHMFIG